jgi:nitrate reductase molybdenum cofactor assembly chaperone NarJ/NarW
MSKKSTANTLSCRVLARLLDYPSDATRAALGELRTALHQEAALSSARLAELDGLMRRIGTPDAFSIQAYYVDSFDRGRATSLHMFEHVHGDSRERGPALVDLAKTYEAGGLFFDPGVHPEGEAATVDGLAFNRELPDYLPVVLEFASTQPAAVAREFLGEMAHILNTIHSGLISRDNPYAAAVGAVLELAGETPQAVPLTADEPMDEAWAEPPVFDGCSSKGQSRPGAQQPIHIVRKTTLQEGATP